MTREEAIKIIDTGKNFAYDEKYVEAFDMAIKALEQIDKIEQIIEIDNSVIQEDVLKYKMICEVLK